MLNATQWLTEVYPDHGSAFSMKIKQKLHETQSPYQKIEIYDTEYFGRVMMLDGLVMLTARDNFIYHEMMSHAALFTHPQPQQVLIIGGGDCGTLREVLKHDSVTGALQVEIDEQVTRVAEQFFPELCASNQDPRAQFYFGDGIQWVKDCGPQRYDVIIIDSTDPVGPAAGLFQREFYQSCRQALRPDGILVQQSESPLFHLPLIQSVHEEMQAAGFDNRLSLVFPQCSYPSGWWSATLASSHTDLTQFRQADAQTKAWPSQYYTAAVHQAAMALPAFMQTALNF